MAQTKIKAGLFEGIIGNGTDGYFLMSNGDGTMTWSSIIINPTITSIAYPGSVTAADPAGGETITVTGTGFKTGATITVGGTAAPVVSYVSETQITFTTPAKAAGDYDIVFTNTDTGSATYINGISYNGIPTWTTAAGSLGTFASAETISTITLAATEPDGGTITFNITNGALPTGLSLTGANIDGTTSLETAETLYTFTVTATDNESQTTPRVFTITVKKQFKNYDNFTINTYTGNGSTQSIEGKINTAASFNGSSSYISAANILDTSSAFTYSLWVNPNTISDLDYLIGHQQPGSPYAGVGLLGGSSNRFYLALGGSTPAVMTPSLTLNSWSHIVLTHDGSGNYTCYTNNNGSPITYSGATSNNSSNAFRIGFSGTSGWNYFDGKIDQARIFNKALSSSEVTTLYGESNTSTTKSTTDIFSDSSGVALYEFEEGAKDTGGVSGYIGSGGIFNGSSSHIDLGTTDFVQNNNSLSISAWCYFEDLSTANPIVTKWNNSGIEESWWFGHYGGGSTTLHFAHRDSANNVTTSYSNTGAISENTWHHCVGVWSGNTVTYYVDGTQVGTSTNSDFDSPTKTSNANIIIGAQNEGVTNFMNGKIDQVRLFNKGLSSSEVTTLYNETSASSTKSTTDIFDDGSGVALYELEGNANDTGLYGSGAIDAGQSAVFNGTNSSLTASRMFSTSSSYSISFWVKMALGTTTENCYFWQINGVTQRALMVNYSGSGTNYGFSFNHKGATNSGQSNTVTFVPDGNWHHFVGTFNSSTSIGSLYIDGVQKDSFNLDPVSDTGNTLYMGGNYAYNGVQYYTPLSGLDQVRIYNTALSQSDVEALVSETNVPTANLVAHYKLDGDATDETGSYNGTASNVTYSDPAEYPTYNGTTTNVTYGYDGTPTNVSFVGTSFQPDFVWIKKRSGTQVHNLYDSVRGVSKVLYSNLTNAEATVTSISSFDNNGFTLGTGGADTNGSGQTYVAWNWKAGGTAVSNTDGSITSSVSANQDAGFSIVSYTGSPSSTVGHGLNQAPEFIFLKIRNNTQGWAVYHSALGDDGYIEINDAAAASTITNYWNGGTSGVPNSSVFGTGPSSGNGNANGNIIAYCFHSVDGYQKVGSYTGNGSTTGPIITTGFRPRFILTKPSSIADNWSLWDNVRDPGNTIDQILVPNNSGAESANGFGRYDIDLLSNGFQLKRTDSQVNQNGATYIYLAIA
jgi:hypothetical protein